MDDEIKVKEVGELCCCGGDIDHVYRLDDYSWQGRCYQCGLRYTVIQRQHNTMFEPCGTHIKSPLTRS